MTDGEPGSPRDLAAGYALGAMSPEEARRFEELLATTPELQREVAQFRDVVGLMALACPDEAPDPALKDRVLARVRQEKSGSIASTRSGPPGARTPLPVWAALAASLILILGLGAQVLLLRSDLARLNRDLASRQQQIQTRDATLDAILEPGVELYQLTASGDPDPGIQLFWDRKRNSAIIHGFRLKPVPEGKAYQLWFIQDGKPVPSVTFKPEPTGRTTVEQVQVPTGGKVSAAAVTLEPATGSSQPTSPILLVGQLGKS